MKLNSVQLLVRSQDSNFNKQIVTTSYPGISIVKSHTFENGKYIALDVSISPETKPGKVIFQLINGKQKSSFAWPLQARRNGNGTSFAMGANSSDFIYLIMPDRFSNGDVKNDKVAGMRDQTLNRDSLYHRHGGDILGIINHID